MVKKNTNYDKVENLVSVEGVAQVLANGPVALSTNIRAFSHELDLSPAPFRAQEILHTMGSISFYVLLCSTLEQFVMEKGYNAQIQIILDALEILKINDLKEKVEAEYPTKPRIVIRTSYQKKLEHPQRYVPVAYQLPEPVESIAYIQRKEELDELTEFHYAFQASTKADGIALVSGLQGVGKSTFVAHFCHLIREIYHHSVIWFQCESKLDFYFEMNQLLNQIGGKSFNVKDSNFVRKAFTSLFEIHCDIPMLIVLENVEKDSMLLFEILKTLNSLPPPKAFVIMTSIEKVLMGIPPSIKDKNGESENNYEFDETSMLGNKEVKPYSFQPFPLSSVKNQHYEKALTGDVFGSTNQYFPLELRFLTKLITYGNDNVDVEDRISSSQRDGERVEISICAEIGLKLLKNQEKTLKNCGLFVLFIMCCFIPLKKFPYQYLLDIFKVMKFQKPKKDCVTEFKKWIKKIIDPYHSQENEDLEKEFWKEFESTTLTRPVLETLRELGFCQFHPIVFQANIYSLPNTFIDIFIEVHDKIRMAVADSLANDQGDWKDANILKFINNFPHFEKSTRDFLYRHGDKIKTYCKGSKHDEKLAFLLVTGPMNDVFVLRLRLLSYLLGFTLITSIIGIYSPAISPVVCTNVGGCNQIPRNLVWPFALIGSLISTFPLIISIKGRFHSPNFFGKYLIYNEKWIKKYLKFVALFATIYELVMIGILSYVAPISTTFIVLNLIGLIIMYYWCTPKEVKKDEKDDPKKLLPIAKEKIDEKKFKKKLEKAYNKGKKDSEEERLCEKDE